METNQINNQQLLQLLKERINNGLISEKELRKIINIRKEQRLSEYEQAANDPEEQTELKNWAKIETEGWDE